VTSALVGHFAHDIVAWQQSHGRNSLPWQNTRDPYRVWLSEIMLQQTQVSTVLDYYARFLDRFPSVAELASAQADDVLALWSGLGYYSRARNLHRCAQDVVALHAGKFPQSAHMLQTLPGIGPSTAAAIASFCFSERVAILDGNVKRVLTRVLAFSDDLASGKNEKQLWVIANSLLPEKNLTQTMPRYTQGVMDLGATICTSRKPQCLICPVQKICKGFAQGEPEKYPVKTKKLKRSVEHLSLLWAQKPDGSVWLERRPESGIWGGLYCLPVFENQEALLAFLPARNRTRTQLLPTFKHVLTHKDMHLSPLMAGFFDNQKMPLTNGLLSGGWFLPDEIAAMGLPAPIRKLLEKEPA
jgi:A/G-specific adenine glycosylase